MMVFRQNQKQSNILLALLITVGLGGQATAQSNSGGNDRATTQRSAASSVQFRRVTDESIVRLEQLARRKWDSPVVADLDQDGHNDFLVNEHTHFISIYWGNGRGFTPRPTTMALGDLHGISVADINGNGLMNVIVSQGGGRGGKPKKPLLFEVNRNRNVRNLGEIERFAASRGRALKLIDNDRDGQPDVIYTGAPIGEQVEDGANFLHINTALGNNRRSGGNLISSAIQLPRTQDDSVTKTLVTDFDNDGFDDIIFYGLANPVFARAVRNGKAHINRTRLIGPTGTDLTNVSGISEIDFDNDGDFDLVVTREATTKGVHVDYNDRNDILSVFTRTQRRFEIDVNVGRNLNLVNLQLSAPRFQRIYVGRGANLRAFPRDRDFGSQINLSIAANDRTQGFPAPSDIRRPGLYAGYLGNGVWRLAFLSRSLASGVSLDDENPLINLGAIASVSAAITNVRTRPVQDTQRPSLRTIILENRNGVFRNVTRQLGVSITEETTGSTIGDFNNDGWMDILVARRGSGGAERYGSILLLNDKGRRFTRQRDNGTVVSDFGSTGRHSQTIDFNEDGRLDIISANERGHWHLFRNASGARTGNYVTINVGRSVIKRRGNRRNRPVGQPHGAKVTVTACGNRMVQRVGSGGAYYSTNANTKLHFGLGECNRISRVVVQWTDGSRTSRENLNANRVIPMGEFVNIVAR